jgi:histidine triad (HIT) family protein
MNKNCVYCQIIAGKLPCYKIYEDDDFLAFLDIFPWVDGHTLVIPKKHLRWVWDFKNPGDYFAVVTKIANHYKQAFDTEFIMSFIYGYDVEHAHIHLLPDARGKIALYQKGKKEKLEEEKAKEIIDKAKFNH